MNKCLNALGVILVIGIILSMIYASYVATKTVSYKLWYEDQVKQTIRENVGKEYLKEENEDKKE